MFIMSYNNRENKHVEGFGVLIDSYIKRNDPLTISEAVELLGINTKNKRVEVVLKRYLFWAFLKAKTRMSNAEIAKFTNHDRTTVLCGLKHIGQGRSKKEIDGIRSAVMEVLDRINLEGYEKRKGV